jgi:hypothetical protein
MKIKPKFKVGDEAFFVITLDHKIIRVKINYRYIEITNDCRNNTGVKIRYKWRGIGKYDYNMYSGVDLEEKFYKTLNGACQSLYPKLLEEYKKNHCFLGYFLEDFK